MTRLIPDTSALWRLNIPRERSETAKEKVRALMDALNTERKSEMNTNRILAAITVGAAISLAGCSSDADVASHNLSKAADYFEINRRVVFYNGITDSYMLTIEGRCSLGNTDGPKELTVTCKTGPNSYKKHFLGLSDNVTYFVEQLDGADVSTYHYRVTFKPQTILPDIDFRGDAGELMKDRN